MKGFTYRGSAVTILATANMLEDLKPNGEHAGVIQQLLDGFKWRVNGQSSIETFEVDLRLPVAIATNNGLLLPFWATHRDHRANPPQLSPFINKRNRPFVSNVTIELSGTPHRAMLKAYPGEYIPPLPWQNSARHARGGHEHCLEFWRSHSYLYSDGLIDPASYTNTPPSWWSTS